MRLTKRFSAALIALIIALTALNLSAGAVGISDTLVQKHHTETDFVFSGSRQYYYSKPYIFEMCWNISDKTQREYNRTRIAVSDKSKITVWYGDSLKNHMNTKSVTAALAGVLERIKAENPEMNKPMVAEIKNVGNASPQTLLKRYYKNGRIVYFSAVFPFADSKIQREYLKKSFDDEDTLFFSICLNGLDNISLAKRYVEKAYADNKIAFFSICLNSLIDCGAAENCIEKYAEKAYDDGKLAFFSVLSGEMSDEALRHWFDRASKDGRASYKALCECDDFDDWDDWDNCDDNFPVTDDATLQEYAEYGVTIKNGLYYYKGEIVRCFLDFQYYGNYNLAVVETNPKGTTDIKIVRDKNGYITNVELLTAKEIEEYFGDIHH